MASSSVMRAAAIDIGTNSVLLLIAERRGDEIVAVEERATITRLGQGVDRTRRLSTEASERTLRCLGTYAELVRGSGAEVLDVVGTSALRDARGSEAFLSDAESLLGTRPQIIDGAEEALLSFEGALSGLALDGAVSVCDIGGGSTELIVGSVAGSTLGRIARSVSLDVGSVRLFERHVKSDPPARPELAKVHSELEAALASVPTPPRDAALVGVAGTVTTLAAIELGLAEYDAARIHGARLTRRAIEDLAERLAQIPLEERKRLRGLDPERADVIVVGAEIAAALLRWADARELVVSSRGLRWGVVQRRLAP